MSRKQIELYWQVSSDRKIVDQFGKTYTPDEARAHMAVHPQTDHNIAFARLVAHDYDLVAAYASLN